MRNKFSIILNSRNKVSGTNNEASFFVDISAFENCEYDVSVKFNGIGFLTALGTDTPPLLFIDMGQNNVLSNNRASDLIGVLNITSYNGRLIIASSCLDSLVMQQVFRLQNQITVRLTNFDETSLWFDSSLGEIRDYIIILTFEKRI